MNFSSPPRDASVENLLELCEVLREGEQTREGLYGEVDQGESLVRDNIRFGVRLGFLEESDDGVTITSRGVEASYNQDDSEELSEQFRAGIQDYGLYRAVLGEIVEEVISDDERVVEKPHVLRIFRTSIGLEGSERTLSSAATTYLQTLEAAGLGEYVVGRMGKETRLEINDEFEGLVEHIIELGETDSGEEEQAQSNEESEAVSREVVSGVEARPSIDMSSEAPFQVSLELSGDENPDNVEELVVAVRRGFSQNLTEPVDVGTDEADDQSKSDDKLDTEPEEVEDDNSSDQSLDTFMGSDSESVDE